MLKEIYEQPKYSWHIEGRIIAEKGVIKLSGVDDHIDKFLSVKKLQYLLVEHRGTQHL